MPFTQYNWRSSSDPCGPVSGCTLSVVVYCGMPKLAETKEGNFDDLGLLILPPSQPCPRRCSRLTHAPPVEISLGVSKLAQNLYDCGHEGATSNKNMKRYLDMFCLPSLKGSSQYSVIRRTAAKVAILNSRSFRWHLCREAYVYMNQTTRSKHKAVNTADTRVHLN